MEKSWLQRIFNDDDADELEETSTPIQLIQSDSRTFVWWICHIFKVNHSGIPGQACQLFERSLAKLVKKNAAIQEDSRTWRRWVREQKSRLPLMVSVSVWLAVKMSTAEVCLSTSIISEKLMRFGFFYNSETIQNTEMEVFCYLNFRIPMWTTVEKALLLAREVGIPQYYLDNIATMVDFAESRRQRVQERVVWVARDSTPSSSTGPRPELRNMRNSHFCAGAIVALINSINYTDSEMVSKLAKYTKCAGFYINCIADAITLEYHRYTEISRKPSLKRKHDDDNHSS